MQNDDQSGAELGDHTQLLPHHKRPVADRLGGTCRQAVESGSGRVKWVPETASRKRFSSWEAQGALRLCSSTIVLRRWRRLAGARIDRSRSSRGKSDTAFQALIAPRNRRNRTSVCISCSTALAKGLCSGCR